MKMLVGCYGASKVQVDNTGPTCGKWWKRDAFGFGLSSTNNSQPVATLAGICRFAVFNLETARSSLATSSFSLKTLFLFLEFNESTVSIPKIVQIVLLSILAFLNHENLYYYLREKKNKMCLGLGCYQSPFFKLCFLVSNSET